MHLLCLLTDCELSLDSFLEVTADKVNFSQLRNLHNVGLTPSGYNKISLKGGTSKILKTKLNL